MKNISLKEERSLDSFLKRHCHIFPKKIDESGRLIVDYELFELDTTLRTAEYRVPENYSGIGTLVNTKMMHKGGVSLLHFNEDGSIFCTRRPAYGSSEEIQALCGEDVFNTGSINNGTLVVDGRHITYGDLEIDPDAIFGVYDGPMVCEKNGPICLKPQFPQRMTADRYALRLPDPVDPNSDSKFYPGFPGNVVVRMAWRYMPLSDLPDGTYSRCRIHKLVSQMVDGKMVAKFGVLTLNDRDGDYPITDNHLIVKDLSLDGSDVKVETFQEKEKTISVANKALLQPERLYTYCVNEDGSYTLTPDTTKTGDGEQVFATVSEDHFLLCGHGNREFITTRCAVVVEENGHLRFGHLSHTSPFFKDKKTNVRVWGKVGEADAYEFAYISYTLAEE